METVIILHCANSDPIFVFTSLSIEMIIPIHLSGMTDIKTNYQRLNSEIPGYIKRLPVQYTEKKIYKVFAFLKKT